MKPPRPRGVFGGEDFHEYFRLFNSYRTNYVLEFVSSEELVHVIYLVEFIGIKLFLVFPYLFNVIQSVVILISLISDIGKLRLTFFLPDYFG